MNMESNNIFSPGEKGLFRRKGLHNLAVALHALLQVAFYVKARLCRSQRLLRFKIY